MESRQDKDVEDVTHVWELDPTVDIVEVLIPFRHLGLVCGQVRANKAQGRGVEQEPDNHTPFITCLPRHARLNSTDSYVPLERRGEAPYN